MMNSVSSNDLTIFTPLIEYSENEVCYQFLPVYIVFGCFTLAVAGFLTYYFVM